MRGYAPSPTVSVLLPTYNRAQFLDAALDSILAQSFPPFEIIVLDDGSADNTTDVCRRYQQVRYERIEHNGGKTAAINRGLDLARGEYVWIMDDDDIAPSDALETLLAPLEADHRLGFAFGALQKFTMTADGALKFESPPEFRPAGPRRLFVHLMEDCFITGQPCTLFRRRCLAEVAPLDPAIVASVDYNILLQVARRHSGADVGRVVLWQRQHSGLRGPEAARYTSRQRVERWKAFDQKLLAALLPELDLCEFMEDVPDGRLTPLQTRHAYFQKAVIAGRKDLWEIAIESIRRGVLATSDVPLGRNERQTLSRMLASRYGIDLFLGNTTIQRRLAKAAGERDIGRAVRLSIASMLTYWTGWGLRKGAPSALASFAALVRLTGLRGAAALLVGVLRRRIGASLTAASGQGKGAMQPAYPAEDYSTEVAN